jgi:hypothetical protein
VGSSWQGLADSKSLIYQLVSMIDWVFKLLARAKKGCDVRHLLLSTDKVQTLVIYL